MGIPKRHYQRWDGGYKNLTNNCSECRFYRRIKDNQLCGWGIAFKYLIKPEKTLRKCDLSEREQTKYPSFTYLDEVIVAQSR